MMTVNRHYIGPGQPRLNTYLGQRRALVGNNSCYYGQKTYNSTPGTGS